jgi:hypothetical protein
MGKIFVAGHMKESQNPAAQNFKIKKSPTKIIRKGFQVISH